MAIFQSGVSAVGIPVDARYLDLNVFVSNLASGQGFDVFGMERHPFDVTGYYDLLMPYI